MVGSYKIKKEPAKFHQFHTLFNSLINKQNAYNTNTSVTKLHSEKEPLPATAATQELSREFF